ncbi:hypothetical protein ARMGADRAFT_1083485 [Armillaria gallica]|uniref:Uncharacterized protein n=1 Tax=Armillaria gallica TaxID=47427 RepID=A0A2H3D2J2_ARMGA|nr:hypothetical protein ARMGADRAFT_1083485 [Armillaria gallica]
MPVDARIYVFASGQKQTLSAPDYHVLPFMNDDNEDDDDLHSPVKAEGSAIKHSALTSPISCSNSTSPTKHVHACSISKPQSRGLSFPSSTPMTPKKLTQHINSVTPWSYVDPPTPKSSQHPSGTPTFQKSSQHVNPATPLLYVDASTPTPQKLSQHINPAMPMSYDPSTPKLSSHCIDPLTPASKQLSPTATQILLSLDGLMMPDLKTEDKHNRAVSPQKEASHCHC